MSSSPSSQKSVENKIVNINRFKPLQKNKKSLASSWVSRKLYNKQDNKDISAAFNLLELDTKVSISCR